MPINPREHKHETSDEHDNCHRKKCSKKKCQIICNSVKGDKGDPGNTTFAIGNIISFFSGSTTPNLTNDSSVVLGSGVSDNLLVSGDTFSEPSNISWSIIVPKNTLLNNIYATAKFFSASIILQPVTITVSLYQSANTSNDYTIVPTTTVTLAPTLLASTAPNTIISGSLSNLNIVIPAGTKLLLLWSGQSSGNFLLSAGLNASLSLS